MFGKGRSRLYNLISLFFIVLSVIFLVFVLLQLTSG